MLNVNIHFDKEYGDQLKTMKEESGLGWHDFFLWKAGIIKNKFKEKSE